MRFRSTYKNAFKIFQLEVRNGRLLIFFSEVYNLYVNSISIIHSRLMNADMNIDLSFYLEI